MIAWRIVLSYRKVYEPSLFRIKPRVVFSPASTQGLPELLNFYLWVLFAERFEIEAPIENNRDTIRSRFAGGQQFLEGLRPELPFSTARPKSLLLSLSREDAAPPLPSDRLEELFTSESNHIASLLPSSRTKSILVAEYISMRERLEA